MVVRDWSITEHWQRERKLGTNERVDYIKTSGLLTQWKSKKILQFLNEVSSVRCSKDLDTAEGV